MINPWRILGVHRQTSEEDIRKAYIAHARVYHPDNVGSALSPDYMQQMFVQVSEAYKILTDRRRLNMFLKQMLALCKECRACGGKGATYEQVNFHIKIFKACPSCGGAGCIIKENEDAQSRKSRASQPRRYV